MYRNAMNSLEQHDIHTYNFESTSQIKEGGNNMSKTVKRSFTVKIQSPQLVIRHNGQNRGRG